MFCTNCGNKIADGSNFCTNCGARLAVAQGNARSAPQPAGNTLYADQGIEGQYVTKNIVLGPDGIYRWIFEMYMYKNPTIFITLCKVMGIAIGITYFLVLLISVASDGLDAVLQLTGVFLIIALVIIFISGIAYLIAAAIYGGKYIVIFEMSEKEIKHIQLPAQFKKAQVLGWLTVISGLADGNPSMVGLGLVNATRNTCTSVFENVASIQAYPRRDLIKVNQLLNKNQVYAEPEDFDFVYDYIRTRCVNAKISRA